MFVPRRRNLWPALIAFAALSAVTAHAAARRKPAPHYERYVKPLPLDPFERRLLRTLRRWVQDQGRVLSIDTRLAYAATSLLDEGGADGEGAIDRARLHAQRAGWTDGQLGIVALKAPTVDAVEARLRRELAGMEHLETQRVGIAARRIDGDVHTVVLFSHRLLNLLPMPARIGANRALIVAGRLGPELSPSTRVVLVSGARDGHMSRHFLPLKRRSFSHRLNTEGLSRGDIIDVQLLIDRGRGPEAAASAVVGVDTSPWNSEPELLPTIPDALAADPENAVAAMVLGIRQSQQLSLPAQSALLSSIAREHAKEMVQTGRFAHVSPTTGDPNDRLEAAGTRYAIALENLARAASPEQLVSAWLQSPAHRANLLHPSVTSLGIGITEDTQAPESTRLVAVLILARPPDDGFAGDLARRAAQSLNRARTDVALRALVVDPQLSALAERHSREIAGGGRLDHRSPVRGDLVDTIFREADVSRAAADVFVTDTVEVVTRSRHLKERFSHAGIGIYREVSRTGPQLWITVIFASR